MSRVSRVVFAALLIGLAATLASASEATADVVAESVPVHQEPLVENSKDESAPPATGGDDGAASGSGAGAQPEEELSEEDRIQPLGEHEALPIVELNDRNFEAKTQAATGATTGDWFVMFSVPWCGGCRSVAPLWIQLGRTSAEHGVNIGHVDCEDDSTLWTYRRFGIHRYPTLILFRGGRMHYYDGNRQLSSMREFMLRTSRLEAGVPVPPPFTLWSNYVHILTEDVPALFKELPLAAQIALVTVLVGATVLWIKFVRVNRAAAAPVAGAKKQKTN